jgi:hypothetical protein
MPRPRETRIEATPEAQNLRSSTTEPLFGDASSPQRHIAGAPRPGALGGGELRQDFELSALAFSEEEMSVIRAARPPGGTERTALSSPRTVPMDISLLGEHKGLRGEGTPTRKGALKYPLFGSSAYEGQLVEGRRHGFGRQVSAAGEYAGEFREGRHSGFGVRKYVDGGRYEGEWVGGFKHGKGLLVLPNGERYKGDFVRGVVHGCPAARRPAWGPVEVRGRRVAAHAARRLSGATGAGRQNQVWRGAGAVRGPVPGRV